MELRRKLAAIAMRIRSAARFWRGAVTI